MKKINNLAVYFAFGVIILSLIFMNIGKTDLGIYFLIEGEALLILCAIEESKND